MADDKKIKTKMSRQQKASSSTQQQCHPKCTESGQMENLHEVIRRKLLIDGDGMGDERRITILLKTFAKWCMSDESEEECLATYERMLSQLAQCEFAMMKSSVISAMNKLEMDNYESLYRQVGKEIELAHEEIATRKNDLIHAKRVRKNRQEYDALAKVIQQNPDRQENLRNLKELEQDLEKLKQTKAMLEDKLEVRRKQFHVLLSSIHELQQLLEGDETEEEAKSSGMESMDVS